MNRKLILTHTIWFVLVTYLSGCGNAGAPPPIAISQERSVGGGGMDSGGGELHDPDYGTAWFLGTRTVHYCVEIAKDFGVPDGTVHATLQNVLKQWKDYLVERHVNFAQLDDISLALNYRPQAKCDGSEDLGFYFGTSNAKVERAKKHFINPVAFAYRNSYDRKAGWGKGIVWLARQRSVVKSAFPGFTTKIPDWTIPYNLSGMLLHEMGHVLGCAHHDGTIMAADIAILLQGISPKEDLSAIDLRNELTLCWANCEHRYIGQLAPQQEHDWFGPPLAPNPKEVARLFQLFMGRPPQGKIRAEVWYRGEVVGELEVRDNITFHLEDGLGLRDFPLVTTKTMLRFNQGSGVFQVYRESGGGNFMAGGPSFGMFGLASVETATGTTLAVAIERNFTNIGSPMRLEWIDGARRTPLFGTLWPGQAP